VKGYYRYFIRENSKSKIVKKLIECSGVMFGWKMISRLLKIFDVKRIYRRIRSSVRSDWVVYIIVLGYIIILSTITILKHQTFLTSGFDLGIFNQAFHTTLFDGKLFYETGDLSFNPGGSFFGVHFSPIILLLLPFYAIYPNPENLLVMQTAILAIGAFPVYWMARDKLGKNVASAISLVYLLYPPLILLNLNDFHIEAFTSTFFLFSVYYLEREKWPNFFAFMLLAIFTIEFAPIIGVFVALYAFILYRRRNFKNLRKARICIVIATVMAILFIIIALGTKELFNNSTSPISTTFQNILLNPTGLPNEIGSHFGDKIYYIINFLAPLAFLPLLSPESLIMTLPWIGLSFASPYLLYHSIFYQYTGFVIPFVIIALPKGIERLNLQKTRKIIPLLLLATIISLIYVPFLPGMPWNYQLPVPDDQTQMKHEILALIPSNASVLTENDIFPHVSGRANAYMYNATETPISADYVVVDLTSEWYAWVPDISGSKQNPNGYVNVSIERGEYGVFASAQGTVLLKKGYVGEPVLFEPYVFKEDYRSLILDSGSIVEDPNSVSKHVFFHWEKDRKGIFWNGPYIGLPFGLFKVTYVIKVDDAPEIRPNEQLLTVDVTADAGENLLASRTVNGTDVPFSKQWFGISLYVGLKFPARQVEFRGHAIGNHNVYLDYVMVEQISPQPVSELTFNFEDNLRVNQGTISEGVMIHSKGAGTFWYGPYTTLPKGNYTANFWLKLDGPYHGPIMDIVVSTDNGKKILAGSAVNSFDFKGINTWQDFKVDFELPENTSNIEFSGLRVRELAPISFLMVEISPDTSG
jgi:uncharacterized membrane protein